MDEIAFDETPRGEAVHHFVDADGTRCSIEDGASVDEATIRMGVSPEGVGLDGRMHLTRRMAARVADAMRSHLADQPLDVVRLGDRSHSICEIDITEVRGRTLLRLAVTETEDGLPRPVMLLDSAGTRTALRLLEAFAMGSSITSEVDKHVPASAPRLDHHVPASMLARTDLAETGITPQMLVDALCRLCEGHGDGFIRETLGWDAGDEVIRVRTAVAHLSVDDGRSTR